MKQLICTALCFALIGACTGEDSPQSEGVRSVMLTSYSSADTLQFTSSIRSIFEDSQGNYWFGSTQEGVCRFDGEELVYFTEEDGLSHNQVLSIQEDDNGSIWFGTQNGVSSYDGMVMRDHSLGIITSLEHEWVKSDRDLWFNAGIREGVYRYDGSDLYYLAFPSTEVINPNNLYSVTGFSKGNSSMLWIATYAGVFGYNGTMFTVINDQTLGLNIETEPLHIRSILEDSKGRLWIGNNGIGVLMMKGNSIINFSDRQNLIHPTSSKRGDQSMPGTLEHVFTIAEDSRGNIWFGDRDAGIWKYDGEAMTNYTVEDGLSNDFAQSIYEDSKGELWFGMGDGSVYRFDGRKFIKQF